MSAELEVAWQVVVDKWDDKSAHDKFLALVAQTGSYKWAAAQYKQHAGDSVADAQLERIRKAAIATMFATASSKREPDAPYRGIIVMLVVLIVMLVVGLAGVKLLHDLRS